MRGRACTRIIEFIIEQKSFCLFYLCSFVLLESIQLLTEDAAFLSVIAAFAELYILSAFLVGCRAIIEGRTASNIRDSLILSETRLFLEMVLLYLLVFSVYYILSLPIVALEFVEPEHLGHMLDQSRPTSVATDVLFRIIYQTLLCYSIAHIVYFKDNAWKSIGRGIKLVFQTKSVFLGIVLFNCCVKLSGLALNNSMLKAIVEEYVGPLVVPVAVMALFYYFEEREDMREDKRGTFGTRGGHSGRP
jgi:hypothetical protein